MCGKLQEITGWSKRRNHEKILLNWIQLYYFVWIIQWWIRFQRKCEQKFSVILMGFCKVVQKRPIPYVCMWLALTKTFLLKASKSPVSVCFCFQVLLLLELLLSAYCFSHFCCCVCYLCHLNILTSVVNCSVKTYCFLLVFFFLIHFFFFAFRCTNTRSEKKKTQKMSWICFPPED